MLEKMPRAFSAMAFFIAIVILHVIFGIFAVQVQASHEPFEVNHDTDESDPAPSDGICDTDLVAEGKQCTLRAAIESANAHVGKDIIHFNLPPI